MNERPPIARQFRRWCFLSADGSRLIVADDEDQAWSDALGMPPQSEIDAARQRGDRVTTCTIFVDPTPKP